MSSEETKRQDKPFDFHGTWMPGPDPLLIGGKNFASLGNMVPDPNGLCGSLGYTKVTTAQLTASYRHARSGIQLRTKDSLRSAVFIQAVNDTATASAVLQQIATSAGDDVPNVKDFEATPIHIDAAGAGLGRFASWPQNQIAYCNGIETLISGGPERAPAKFVISDGPMADTLTNPVDYTDAIINNLKTPGNVARLSAGPDIYNKLYLHGDDQADGSGVFTDSSYTGGGRTVHTVSGGGDAQISTSYPKFGTGCILFPGVGYIQIADSADFYWANNAFTLDFQLRLTDVTRNHGFFQQYQDANNYISMDYTAATHVWLLEIMSGGTLTSMSFTYTPIAAQYYHLCLQNIPSLNLTTLHLEGDCKASCALITFPDFAADWYMGIGQTSNGARYYQGRMDEIRILKGLSRWPTAGSFTPPSTAGSVNGKVAVVFTTRPIQAVKFYLSNINSITGAAITGKVWDGTAWPDLVITDATSGLTVNEKSVSFPSTVGTAAPKVLDGSLYYVYQFSLSDGEAEIYKTTVDAPMQPIVDLWDEVLRPIIQCRYYHGAVWIDATMNVAEETAAGVTGSSAYVADVSGLTASEYIDLATSEKACAFKITMYERETGKVNTTTATLQALCWDGAQFTAPLGQVDGTSNGGKTFSQSGFVSFTETAPGHEYQKTENGVTLWRYRLKPSATLSGTVWIDKIEAIPASQLRNNLAYKFPFMFLNRPMLCNLMSTGEGNRVDYPLTNSTEGWNGEDSSFGDGKGSLYIGGQEELTAACELYNRLGSSIYTFAIFFKAYHTFIVNGYDFDSYKVFPLNDKIGCPAPLTLDTYTIFTSKEQQSARSIAAWLDYTGPYMFDAGGLTPLTGIECYFEKTDPRCINFAAIEVARGWFDPDSPKYNLQIPSGTGQTTNNVWLIYDYSENKWYPKTPTAAASPYLCAAVRVADANQKQYIYGFRENGDVMRLEYGTTWDGAPIEQHIETGEILYTNTIWEILKLLELKIVALPLTETADLAVTIFKDGKTTGQVIATIPLTSSDRFLKWNDKVNPGDCWSYRLRFATQTSNSLKGMQLLVWGCKFKDERKDNR